MLNLYNRVSKKELKKNILINEEPRFIVSFYKYFFIKSIKEYRDQIYKNFNKYHVLGRVYIADEGINAQISIPVKFYFRVIKFLYTLDSELKDLFINKSLNDNGKAFWFLSVKIKKKIVHDGIKNLLFNPKKVGIYIESNEVNMMLKDRKTIFVDMRNSYEYEIGHFPNAIQIKSQTFRDQLQKVIKVMDYAKNKKIVMYCTGGIRCEKATAWMRFNGFKNVYHLKGGIINYVHNARKNNLPILFRGSNFVFDNRMSEKISDEVISFCKQCNQPSDKYVNCSFNLCHLLFIQCKNCAINFKNCCSEKCMQNIYK